MFIEAYRFAMLQEHVSDFMIKEADKITIAELAGLRIYLGTHVHSQSDYQP